MDIQHHLSSPLVCSPLQLSGRVGPRERRVYLSVLCCCQDLALANSIVALHAMI